MKLIKKYMSSNTGYYCEITSELDKLAGISNDSLWKHYIYCGCMDKCFAIRIPGGTLGSIEFDENKEITKIVVCTDYIVTYPNDVNEQLQKFVGQKIELGE